MQTKDDKNKSKYNDLQNIDNCGLSMKMWSNIVFSTPVHQTKLQ